MKVKPCRVFIAGHRGMVGRALCRQFSDKSEFQLITRSRDELDLTSQQAVSQFMQQEKPDWVIIAAAKVGGILANRDFPAQFIYENLMIESNLIHSAWQNQVQRLLFLGSSCIYPKVTAQPIQEDSLLTGSLEATNEAYAVAKIAGIKLCQSYAKQYGVDFRSLMPTNLYGPFDNFHPEHSHVIPGLMRRMHQAKLENQSSLVIWGTGQARREFLHVDDLAAACFSYLQFSNAELAEFGADFLQYLNVGTGQDLTIAELARLLAEVIGYSGELIFDSNLPEGTLLKRLDISKIQQLGWRPSVGLADGLRSTYQWFLQQEQ
ncbi:MAG: GDP-L-fucose synthase [Gammaproteobacteria bacterium]|nr:GDP-L-fucose synthase [Gammaproteobacteria bacterium]